MVEPLLGQWVLVTVIILEVGVFDFGCVVSFDSQYAECVVHRVHYHATIIPLQVDLAISEIVSKQSLFNNPFVTLCEFNISLGCELCVMILIANCRCLYSSLIVAELFNRQCGCLCCYQVPLEVAEVYLFNLKFLLKGAQY